MSSFAARPLVLSATLLAIGAAALGSTGATAASASTRATGGANAADVEYLKNSANGVSAEITLSRYAEQHATTSAARDLAALLVHDHTGEAKALRTVARRYHVSLMFRPTGLQRAEIHFVESQTGRTFDEQYAEFEQTDHQSDVMTQLAELREGHASGVLAFARRFLPMYRHHLDRASAADEALEGS